MFELPYKESRLNRGELQELYRRVFASPDGEIVLNHLLGETCKMKRIASDMQDVAAQEVGFKIINFMKG